VISAIADLPRITELLASIQSQRLTLHHAIKRALEISRLPFCPRGQGLIGEAQVADCRCLPIAVAYPILALFNSTRHDETLKAISAAASNGRYRSSAAEGAIRGIKADRRSLKIPREPLFLPAGLFGPATGN